MPTSSISLRPSTSMRRCQVAFGNVFMCCTSEMQRMHNLGLNHPPAARANQHHEAKA
jgi:hypothetical protein